MAILKKRADQAHHDQMVRTIAQSLRSRGFLPVYADLPGSDQPYDVAGYRPDVTAYSAGGLRVIAEVETADSIGDDHTAAQWRAFAVQARLLNATFAVVVPSGCTQAAQWRLAALGLTATIWEL